MPILLQNSIKLANQSPRLDFTAKGICFIAFTFWFFFLLNKYLNFGYYDWDFALYSQTMWCLVHGSLEPSLFGINFLANHSNYIAFIIAPIYWLFQHPFTLITLKILSRVVSGYILYKIAKEKIDGLSGIWLLVIYFLYPANIFSMIFEFDFESLAPAFVALLFYFHLKKKFKAFFAVMVLTLLCKENMAAYAVSFGIYSLFLKDYKKWPWGFTPIILGFAYFYLVMFVLTPHFRSTAQSPANIYVGLFSGVGASPQDMLTNIFLNPIKILNLLYNPTNCYYLQELFLPLLLIPLLSPLALMLGLPLLLQNLFSSNHAFHTIYFHYTTSLTVIIFIACIYSLCLIKSKIPPFIYTIILTGLLFFVGFNGLTHQKALLSRLIWESTKTNSLRWQMFNQIPPQSSVVASFSHLPPLSTRFQLYALYNVWLGENYFAGKHFQIPADIQYAFLDLADPWLKDAIVANPQITKRNLYHFFSQYDWRIIDIHKSFVLLRNGGEGIPLLKKYPHLYGLNFNHHQAGVNDEPK